MNRNKICPACRTEYLPNIEKCADCGADLLFSEEYAKVQEETKRLEEKAIDAAVVVREGDRKWLKELHDVLIDAGIPCMVTTDPGCSKDHCGNKWRLLVSEGDLENAKACIEEYFAEIHPEMRASNELASRGKCPACGFPVGASAVECPDCGLAFVIGDEEEADN